MAPKGGNAKKESGRAKKAENEQKKKATADAEKERKEAEKWQDTSKSKASKEDKEEKRRAELARKAENARLLAEEEAATTAKPKSNPKAGAKKAPKTPKPAGPGAIAAGGELAAVAADSDVKEKSKEVAVEAEAEVPQELETFAATGIDNALDLLEVVTAKMDKASVGQQAAGIERHPERRFKAAFEAYKERELPNARKDEILFKQFQKSPENPFNQVVVSYDASKEEKVDALKKKNAAVEERLRERS